MKSSIVCFSVFNWRCPTHWVIAALQLLARNRYWWVVHCSPLIQTTYGQSTIEVRFTGSRLEQYRPDSYRELYFPPFQANSDRIAYLLASSYLLNCADLTLRMSNITCNRYPTPANVYQLALSHTAHRSGISTRDPDSNVAIPTPNYQGDHSGDVRYVPHV